MATPQTKVKIVEAEAGVKAFPCNEGMKLLPVLVTVRAPPRGERTPIDLVALLDVSGSMAWKSKKNQQWTRLDLLKGAMQLAMRRLGAADRLSIVPFNHDAAHPTVLMHMDHKGQMDALQKVLQLKAGGDTKFMPALNQAKRLLGARSEVDKKSRPGFVFLLSDGEDRAGIVGKHIDVGGYPVHTFGMCQQCSPKAMLHIAKETKGTFHSIDDTMKNVAHALSNFISGITSVVAIDARIEFCVPAESKDNVFITSIKCGSYVADTNHHINVGTMYAEETKNIIINLAVNKLTGELMDQPLLSVSGEYNKPNGGEKVAMEGGKTVTVDRPGTPTSPTPVFVVSVALQMVQIQVVTIVHTVVTEHMKDGEPINQILMATQIDTEWSSYLVKAMAMYVHPDAQKGIEAHGKFVEGLSTLLREDHHNVGVLYAHSWLASQATQQVTTFAMSSTVESWFHQEYMILAAHDLEYEATSMVTPPGGGGGEESDPCKCVDFDRIDQRLSLWSKVKREVPDFFQPSEDAESHHLTAVIREASLDAINRAMHQDMYLAVVHASNLRRCYCAAGKQPLGDVPTPKDDHH